VIALVALSLPLIAQEPVWVHVNFRVTDAAGAVIPTANIRTGIPSLATSLDQSGLPIATVTDKEGKAFIDLPPGQYDIEVIASGFMPLYKRIDLAAGSPPVLIPLILRIGGTCEDGCVIFTVTEVVHTTLIDVSPSLPLQPLQQFPLPSVRPRRRFL
jgi:hypothetical protein